MTGRVRTTASTPFNSTVTVMPTPWNAQHQADACGDQGLRHRAGRTAEGQPRLPARRVGLDERARQAAAAAVGLPAAGRQAQPGGHGVDRHLCRQCRHRAGADQGVGARQDPVGDRQSDAGRLDGRRGGHPRGLQACRTVLRQGRRQPRDAGDRRRLQCRPDRRRRSEAHHRGEAQDPASSCRSSASAAAISTTR